MRVYKFLEKRWAIEALKTRRLKIARLNELNDPFEFFPFDLTNRPARMALQATLSQISGTRGFVCFSRSWSDPVIWSHYAQQHMGICLGFDIPDDLGFEVRYVQSRLPFPDFMSLDLAGKIAAVQTMLFTKFSHWAYEAEIRTTVALDPSTETNGMYFMDFGVQLRLAEVILGLRSGTCPREIDDALDGYMPHPTVIRATASLEGFSVVEDPTPLRNHDELVYHVKRGDTYHPVRFVL